MIYSMTGFGRDEIAIQDKSFLIEIKSLNGKQFDLRLTLPALLKPFEFDIRNLLNEQLERGSVECVISLTAQGVAKPVIINTHLVKNYYLSLKETAQEIGAPTDGLLASILRMPEVVVNNTEVLSEDSFQIFKKKLASTIQLLINHREKEGKSLYNDLSLRINNIIAYQKEIEQQIPVRIEKIREQIVRWLEEKTQLEKIDYNRLEQELIYFIERNDISEEQVRLKNHCEYFFQILNEKERLKGKKLGFILQEIGREINTTGAKANDASIQKWVVLMKDELEKAKEQILNVM